MLRFVTFYTLLPLAVGYALVLGKQAERAVATIFVLAWAATTIALRHFGHRYTTPETGVMVIDLATLIALTLVALKADRFWPMPLAAMQGVSILAHVAELIRPELAGTVYSNAVELWSYPQLAFLCLGTLRVDLRRRHFRLGAWPLAR